MAGVLDGIKVLDLSRIVAGPLCTQMLSDAGATVYKIERPSMGDDTRSMGPYLPGREGDLDASTVFLSYNRGKKSIVLDITTEEGIDIILRLAAQCDIFVENFKAGNLAKYGLDYENIRKISPEIIYCSLSGFGQTGPYAEHVAYDFILQGMAGVMSSCGHPDGEPGGGPMRTAIPITDVVAGLNANSAILGALVHKLRTGKGQYIDACLLDAAVALNGHLGVSYLATGQEHPRIGNRNPIASPSEVFKCADGYLIIAAGNNSQFQAMCDLLGLPELKEDERFITNPIRVQNREILTKKLAEKVKKWKQSDLLSRLAKARVPTAPINGMKKVFDDEQVRHRDLVIDVNYGENEQRLKLLRSPLRYTNTPIQHQTPPQLGEHTKEVLRNELQFNEDKLKYLREQGIIG